MFNFFENKRTIEEENRIANEARKALANELSEMILNDPEMPDSYKVGIHIIREAEKLSVKVYEMARRFSLPDQNPAEVEKNYPVRREVLEYILLVSGGIDTFLETLDVPAPGED